MLRRFSLRYVLFSLLMDVGCVVGAFLLAEELRRVLPYGRLALYGEGIPPAAFYPLIVAVWILVALLSSLYDPGRIYKAVDEFQRLTLAVGFFALGNAGVLYFSFRSTSRLLVAYGLALTGLLLVTWRAGARLYYRRRHTNEPGSLKRVLIIGAGKVGQRVAETIRTYAWAGLHLAGYLDDDPEKQPDGLPVLGTLGDVRRVVAEEGIDDVVLALPPRAHERVNEVVSELHDLPVRVRVVPDYFSLALFQATVDDFGGLPMINLRDPALNDYQRLVKRVFDLVVGGALTVAASPLMAAVAVAVKLDSPGPVLFRQKRVGENCQPFEMLKFRSMVCGADEMRDMVTARDEDGNLIYKCEDDPRVTRVGHFIRRTSLDELPQLFNVLRGDMSLVGPRPELPWLVKEYEPWQRKRFAVPQGVTGWWQINGRSDKPMHLHTKEDLFYVQNYSVWLDLLILLKTPLAVVRGKGAY